MVPARPQARRRLPLPVPLLLLVLLILMLPHTARAAPHLFNPEPTTPTNDTPTTAGDDHPAKKEERSHRPPSSSSPPPSSTTTSTSSSRPRPGFTAPEAPHLDSLDSLLEWALSHASPASVEALDPSVLAATDPGLARLIDGLEAYHRTKPKVADFMRDILLDVTQKKQTTTTTTTTAKDSPSSSLDEPFDGHVSGVSDPEPFGSDEYEWVEEDDDLDLSLVSRTPSTTSKKEEEDHADLMKVIDLDDEAELDAEAAAAAAAALKPKITIHLTPAEEAEKVAGLSLLADVVAQIDTGILLADSPSVGAIPLLQPLLRGEAGEAMRGGALMVLASAAANNPTFCNLAAKNHPYLLSDLVHAMHDAGTDPASARLAATTVLYFAQAGTELTDLLAEMGAADVAVNTVELALVTNRVREEAEITGREKEQEALARLSTRAVRVFNALIPNLVLADGDGAHVLRDLIVMITELAQETLHRDIRSSVEATRLLLHQAVRALDLVGGWPEGEDKSIEGRIVTALTRIDVAMRSFAPGYDDEPRKWIKEEGQELQKWMKVRPTARPRDVVTPSLSEEEEEAQRKARKTRAAAEKKDEL